jgi:hypothetical protein
MAEHSASLIRSYAFEFVVFTDCPPGPEERTKFV